MTWALALKNLGRRPRRTVLSALAIGVAALSMTCLFSLLAGIKNDLAENLQRFSTGQILVEDKAMAESGALTLEVPRSEELRKALEKVPGVTAVSPRITSAASVFQDGDAVIFPFMGLDFSTDPSRFGDFLLTGGRIPDPGTRQAVISSGLAQKFGLKTGDTLTAVTRTLRGSSNGMTFTVTGVVRPTLAQFQTPWLFTSVETARRFTRTDDGATSLLVSTGPGADLTAVALGCRSVVSSRNLTDVDARIWSDSSAQASLMDLAQAIYIFIGLVFFALASTVVVNTMLMVVLERAQEIGMLGALGMDRWKIRNLFLAESAVLSALGAGVGTLGGCVVTLVLQAVGLDYGEAMKGVDLAVNSVLRPSLEWWIPPSVFGAAVAVALGFTLVPLRRVEKMEIVEALRGER